MRKGFTLVEIIGVIVLIGAVALISIPVVEKQVKDGNQKMYDSQISYIELAAENWLSDNINFTPNNNETITILLSQLKQGDYIASDIKNPLTKELFPNDMEIEISRVDGILKFNILTNTGTDYSEYDVNTPNIVVKGNIITKVELGSIYTDVGAVATTRTGTNLAVTTTGSVNTSVIGSYNITYSVNDNGHTNSMIRTVLVKDTKAPEVTITGGELDVYDNQVATIDLNDITVTDNSGSYNIEISGGLSTIPGKYTITYIVSDPSGNVTTKFRNVNVVRSGNPVFVMGNSTVEMIVGSSLDLTLGVKATDPNGYALNYTCKIGANNCETSGLSVGTYTVTYTATFNSNTTTINRTLNVTDSCPYTVNQQFNFTYTGSAQTFTPECDGTYKLEVWGAQGGGGNNSTVNVTSPTYVGLGAYSIGTLNVSKNTNLYVYVGGEGKVACGGSTIANGGWNGGGAGHSYSGNTYCNGGGGGSTDIRTTYNDVTYQNYSYYTNNTDSLNSRKIVAAGGGGLGHSYSNPSAGSSGGGYVGVNGATCCGNGNYGVGGGTQTSGFSFGYGGYAVQSGSTCAGGGGGGYYGGGASTTTDCNNYGGSGGSGYIGGVISSGNITKAMYCYNCTASSAADTLTYTITNYSDTPTANYAKSGNGYARITYLGN